MAEGDPARRPSSRWFMLGIVLTAFLFAPVELGASATTAIANQPPEWVIVARLVLFPLLLLWLAYKVLVPIVPSLVGWMVASQQSRAAEIEAQQRLAAAIQMLAELVREQRQAQTKDG